MNASTLRQRAEQHALRGEWTAATACFEELLVLRPGDADVLLQLSYMASLAGNYRRARQHALAAAATRPVDPAQVQELIARLRTFNEVPALHDCLARLQPVSRMPLPLLLAFGAQLSYLEEHHAALALFDEARRRDPAAPATLVARAQVLIYLGRLDEAQADLLACTRRAPGMPRAWALLVSVSRQTPSANHVDSLRRLLTHPGLKPEDVAELGYALHKSLDDLGDHEGAWKALELACRARRSTLEYQPLETVHLVDALVNMPLPAAAGANHAPAPVPIFIVGMHRSGTTLLEQLLQGHSDVRGLGELYDFASQMREATDHHCRGVIDIEIVRRAGNVDFPAVGAGYLGGVAWRLGSERFFTDKLPSNFLHVGFICRALPQARILHMRRDAMETCFSNLRELFHDANPYSYDQQELGAFYRQYQRLMAHWSKVFPGRILDVDYGELVADPEKTLRRVTQFCGLSFEPAMLDLKRSERGVSTASAVAVRQQIVKPVTPKWAPYARQLQPLAAALEEPSAP